MRIEQLVTQLVHDVVPKEILFAWLITNWRFQLLIHNKFTSEVVVNK